MKNNIIEIQEKLQAQLTKNRYLHTLGVQYTSASLAMRYGGDIMQAQIAGLLHDCAKYLTDDLLLSKCKKFHIAITEVEQKNAFLLHPKLGAYYAEHKYNITDSEILDAITYHTTGRPDMALLEKIVFIADYMEPSRAKLKGLEEIRRYAFEDLDKAMYFILNETLQYLKEDEEKEIDPTTVKAYEYYRRLYLKVEKIPCDLD